MELRAPRLAIVHPYWSFWEHTAGRDFRGRRLDLARRLGRELQDLAEVVAVGDLASVEDAQALANDLRVRAPDAILILQTMAVPPAFVLALLDELDRMPLVVWAMHEHGLVDGSFDHGGITTQGATVGAPMLANVLIRRGRPFDLVLGRSGDPECLERVRGALRSALVAGQLGRARVGRVGQPLEGYLHVDVEAEALRLATGIQLVPIEAAEVLERYRAVPDSHVRDLESELAGWDLAPEVTGGESLIRSLRAAAALESLVADHRLDAGALSCHVPEIRFGDEIGVTPCYGLGRLTSAGVPWTCTGDVLTAVAMLTTKRLGGAALYHEIEAVDYATGEVVLANSGEHDTAWLAPGERPRLRRNGWFCAVDPRCGVGAVFEPAAGPATLVGFTPHPADEGGFRYVVARGELTGRRFPETGTVNGAFRFREGTVEEAWTRWAEAGVNHHSSATPGDLAPDVAGVARHLGIGAVIV
ncbi:MAG: hypothetical protein H0V12_00670 [Chloroflexi bacterium]|nr:hypothetical protein [Chloroflexota bacterium]